MYSHSKRNKEWNFCIYRGMTIKLNTSKNQKGCQNYALHVHAKQE